MRSRHVRKAASLAAVMAVMLASSPPAFAGALEDELFESVRKNDLGAVRSSLDAGADVFATNMLGNRAADVAVDLGYFDVAHYLLSVMDHLRRAREVQDTPPAKLDAKLHVPVQAAAAEVAPAPASKPTVTAKPTKPTPFDVAASDKVFSPNSPPKKTLPIATSVLRVEPDTAPAPSPKRAKSSAPSAKDATPATSSQPPAVTAGQAKSAQPTRTLDDIVKTASKVDSTLHVEPGASSSASASPGTPKPMGLFAGETPAPQEREGETQQAIKTAEAIPSPTAQVVPETKAKPEPSQAHQSVLHVPAPSPAAETPPTVAMAPAPVENQAAQQREEDEQGWLSKVTRYLGIEGEKEGEAASATAENTTPSETEDALEDPAKPRLETAALVPPPAPKPEPRPASPSNRDGALQINAALRLGKTMPYNSLEDAPCIDKRRQGVICMEEISWPKDLAPYFTDMSSALYRGTKAVVGYREGRATFIYAVFPSTQFDDVVAALTKHFGPPINSQRGVRPLGEDLRANLVRTWSATDADTAQPMSLEVSMYDDQREAFPVMHEATLMMTYIGSDSVFRYVEPMELQRLK